MDETLDAKLRWSGLGTLAISALSGFVVGAIMGIYSSKGTPISENITPYMVLPPIFVGAMGFSLIGACSEEEINREEGLYADGIVKTCRYSRLEADERAETEFEEDRINIGFFALSGAAIGLITTVIGYGIGSGLGHVIEKLS